MRVEVTRNEAARLRVPRAGHDRGDARASRRARLGRQDPGRRPEHTQLDFDDRWKLMTVRNWGESPFGTWTLNVTDVSTGDISECVDHLWDLETPGRTVDCRFFEKRKYCVGSKVDEEEIASDGNSPLLSLTDEDRGLTFEEACCEKRS